MKKFICYFVFLAFLIATPSQAKLEEICEKQLLRKQVITQKSSGIQRSDRRLRYLEQTAPLNLDRLKNSLLKLNATEDVLLPEFEVEAKYILTTLPEIEAHGKKSLLKRSDHTVLIPRFENAVKNLREKTTELLKNKTGISYRGWCNLTPQYTALINIIYYREGAQLGDLLKLDGDFSAFKEFDDNQTISHVRISDVFKTLFVPNHPQNILDAVIVESLAKGWRLLPTVRTLSVAKLNEWMSKGLLPVGVVNREEIDYDATVDGPWSYFTHDIAHARIVGNRDTGLNIGAETYFETFRERLSELPKDSLKTIETIETLWFIAYHEEIGNDYGPRALKKLVSEAKTDFQEIKRSLLFSLQGPVPQDSIIHESLNWLSKFADGITAKYSKK